MSLATFIAGFLISYRTLHPPIEFPQSSGVAGEAIISLTVLIQGLKGVYTLTPIIIVSIALAMISSTIPRINHRHAINR